MGYGLIKGLGFKVTCVSPPKLGVFLGFWNDLPPHFEGLWMQWCENPTIIVHHLEDMGGYEISWGPDRWRGLKVIIIDFECFEMTYPPIFKCSDANGGVIFT
jgi:hypothetical protein